MTEDFTILIASDWEHDYVFAEIYCKEKFVALVSQENGLDRLIIEFPPPGLIENMIARKIDMEGFQKALIAARKRLAGE